MLLLLDLYIIADDEILNSIRHTTHISDNLYTFKSPFGMGSAALKFSSDVIFNASRIALHHFSHISKAVKRNEERGEVDKLGGLSTAAITHVIRIQERCVYRIYLSTSPATVIQRCFRHWRTWGPHKYPKQITEAVSRMQACFRGHRFRRMLMLTNALFGLVHDKEARFALEQLDMHKRKCRRLIYNFVRRMHRKRKTERLKAKVASFLVCCIYKRRFLLKLLRHFDVKSIVLEGMQFRQFTPFQRLC